MVPFAASIAAWGTAWYSSFPKNYFLWEILTNFELVLQADSALFSLTLAVLYLETQNQLLGQKKELYRLFYT